MTNYGNKDTTLKIPTAGYMKEELNKNHLIKTDPVRFVSFTRLYMHNATIFTTVVQLTIFSIVLYDNSRILFS